MPNPKDIVNLIQSNIDEFSNSIEPIQKKLYEKVSALLKDLSLDAEGNIKQTSTNVDIINSVKTELSSVVNNPSYQKNVAGIKSSLDDVNDLQSDYFSKIDDSVNTPTVVDAVKNQSFDSAVSSLTEAGINENVVGGALDIVSHGITEGTSFADMNDSLRTFMIGNDKLDGKLLSYSKQIVSDTLQTASRNYNSIMTDKLGLEWYIYVGALVSDSRPWCIEMEKKKYIHVSELASCCRGVIDGKKVSLQGLMPDTNKDNVISRCGGFNCEHSMMPISSESVPSNIRRKFDKNISAPTEEDRPRRN